MACIDLEGLFLAHRRGLQAYLTTRLGDRELAADLTQETFLRFAERSGDVVCSQERSYLYRTAQNLAIDHVRRNDRRQTDATVHAAMADVVDDRPGPEATAEARQRLGHLREAVRELPRRTRQIFVLHRIQGLAYAQVATTLQISESSVQKHLARALRHVTQRLDAL